MTRASSDYIYTLDIDSEMSVLKYTNLSDRHFIEDDVRHRDAPRLAVGLRLVGVAAVKINAYDWSTVTCGCTHVV